MIITNLGIFLHGFKGFTGDYPNCQRIVPTTTTTTRGPTPTKAYLPPTPTYCPAGMLCSIQTIWDVYM